MTGAGSEAGSAGVAPASPDAAAILLAGGRSSRMGQPKAALPFDGVPLLAHLLDRLAPYFPERVIVRAPGQELPAISDREVRIVEDAVIDQGPVAGICAGLAAVRCELAFVVTCDVPFLSPRLGAAMVAAAPGFDVVAPEWEGRLNPLQAVYRTRLLPLYEAQLAAGRRRPVDLYPRVAVRTFSEAEVRAVDPEGLSFLNMNTPEEYQRALRLWREHRPCA
jgi:molybdopterin-guanine dinucleotide biosynthesis protein A